VTRYQLINILIARRGYKSYLEIGVDQGQCFRQIKCEKKVGVDPYIGSDRSNDVPEKWKEEIDKEYRNGPATHVMTSDAFFEQNTDTFDIIFIDGLHEAWQVEKDIRNTLDCMSLNGLVVVHDCLPLTKEAQRVPRGDVWGWNGDAWRAVVKVQMDESIAVKTVDTDQGCAILSLEWDVSGFDVADFTWETFNANRAELMNIITVSEFLRIA